MNEQDKNQILTWITFWGAVICAVVWMVASPASWFSGFWIAFAVYVYLRDAWKRIPDEDEDET